MGRRGFGVVCLRCGTILAALRAVALASFCEANPIDDKYAALGGANGFLGPPKEPQKAAPDGIGQFRFFENGAIYWSPASGAHEVHGAILDLWAQNQWERGWGYPLTDEMPRANGDGRCSYFERGIVYWTSQRGAYRVRDIEGPDNTISSWTVAPGVTAWRIDRPMVKVRRTDYPQVRYKAGDRISVDAGGCVQTGGTGDTWKHYLSPSGGDADHLYHGLIWLPGALSPAGAQLVRTQGVIGRTLTIASGVDPSQCYLRLGYEDDGYDDNGYYDHDDGNNNQCRDVGPAWVVVTIDGRQGPSPSASPSNKPLDLVWSEVDRNGFPRNPHWAWQDQHPRELADPQTCVRRVGLGQTDWSACTNVNVQLDNGALCGPHVNWMPVTLDGQIRWQDHSSDDDYNVFIYPQDNNGLTLASQGRITCEFDTDETIDHFTQSWWQRFHDAVDQNDGHSGGAPGGILDNKYAIVTGLFGLDCAHSCEAELHPTWAIAIRAGEDPQDETWACFARNWGDEGFCADNDWRVDFTGTTPVYSVMLPWHPGATGVEVKSSDFRTGGDDLEGGDAADFGYSIEVVPSQGVLVHFRLPRPAAHGRIHGELHLRWIGGPTTATLLFHAAPFAPPANAGPVVENPDEVISEWLATQPRASRNAIRESGGGRHGRRNDLQVIRSTSFQTAIQIPPAGAGGSASHVVGVPDPALRARREALIEAVRGANGGTLPGSIQSQIRSPAAGSAPVANMQSGGGFAAEIAAKAHELNLGPARGETPQPMKTPPPRNQGYFQHFDRGSVYWSPNTGAHVVWGLIRDKWAQQGWEQGRLGFPTSDEMPCTAPDSRDRYNTFQGGTIYWRYGSAEAVVFVAPTQVGNAGNCSP